MRTTKTGKGSVKYSDTYAPFWCKPKEGMSYKDVAYQAQLKGKLETT